MGKSQELYIKAKKLIPGGTQLLSKRPEMFLPDKWPAYYSKAEGCCVWDLDGNKYIDMSYMGIGANILGYSVPEINNAVKKAIDNSSMCTLNCPEEVELAEVLLDIHPWGGMIRYTKTGGEAMAVATRIARAYTGKDVVLFCGYHGWSDWYLAANLAENSALDGHLLKGLNPKGVPRGLIGTSIPFHYNDIDELQRLLSENKGKVAAIVMEPIRNSYPEGNFLELTRKMASEEKIVLIFDEITSGFRLNCGGAHLSFGVEPDVAVLGKAISNGFPLGVIMGKKSIMDVAQETFISSTYWTERTGLVAALETIKYYKDNNVAEHLKIIGQSVQNGWRNISESTKLDITVSGILPLSHFEFNYNNSLALKTFFTQEMLKRGFLATNALYASFAHKEKGIHDYLYNVEAVFRQINNTPNILDKLNGKICHSGFQRLT